MKKARKKDNIIGKAQEECGFAENLYPAAGASAEESEKEIKVKYMKNACGLHEKYDNTELENRGKIKRAGQEAVHNANYPKNTL